MEPDPEDVKKKLEAIVGRELVVAPEQLINSRFPTSTYEYSVGKVAWQHIFLPGMSCLDAELLDVSGASYSGADGKRVVRLSYVVCLRDDYLLVDPINVLATARSVEPFFVTNTHSLISPTNPTDLEITFFAWDNTGQAAPNVYFDWRCRAICAPAPLPPLGKPL